MRYGPVLVSWKPWRPHQSHAFRHASSRRRPGKNRTSRFSNMERTKAGYILGFSHPPADHRNILTSPRNPLAPRRAWVAKLGQRRRAQDPVPYGFAGSNPAPRIPPTAGRMTSFTPDTTAHSTRIDGAPETT